MLLASIAAAILLCLRPLPAGSLQSLVVPLVVMLFVVTSWIMMRQHDRRLCEHCMAAMPLNPAEQATRYRLRFLVTHAGANRRILIGYLVVLFGSNVFVFYGCLSGRLAWTVIQSSMVYLVLSYSTHRRLQPWCPWCSDDGGGEEQVDEPEPLPNDSWQTV
ncbi:MAG: hypothetical protein JO147_11050 [Actinobacteria bacterium]|nr:hypothetical protein [Actinomycetota bacterium]